MPNRYNGCLCGQDFRRFSLIPTLNILQIFYNKHASPLRHNFTPLAVLVSCESWRSCHRNVKPEASQERRRTWSGVEAADSPAFAQYLPWPAGPPSLLHLLPAPPPPRPGQPSAPAAYTEGNQHFPHASGSALLPGIARGMGGPCELGVPLRSSASSTPASNRGPCAVGDTVARDVGGWGVGRVVCRAHHPPPPCLQTQIQAPGLT